MEIVDSPEYRRLMSLNDDELAKALIGDDAVGAFHANCKAICKAIDAALENVPRLANACGVANEKIPKLRTGIARIRTDLSRLVRNLDFVLGVEPKE